MTPLGWQKLSIFRASSRAALGQRGDIELAITIGEKWEARPILRLAGRVNSDHR